MKKDGINKSDIGILLFILLLLVAGLLFYFREEIVESSQKEQIIIETEFCESMPNFSGTPRENEGCETDWDCFNHKPSSYSVSHGDILCVNEICRWRC